MNIEKLSFRPYVGLSSRHLQTICAAFRHPGEAPISNNWIVDIGGGDRLSCVVSTPQEPQNHIVVLVHGLGGSHNSNYMIRLARKFYRKGYKVVRVNLRGCGSGHGLSKLPYNAGTSGDILQVIRQLQVTDPDAPITLIGFSLGGNIVLKLLGELGQEAAKLLHSAYAICPTLDLKQSVQLIEQPRHRLYQRYYLKKILQQARSWGHKQARSIYEFDDTFTAPMWGYSGADAYYKANSSLQFLPHIKIGCSLLFAEDDPFIDFKRLVEVTRLPQVKVWATKKGGHMGFLGPTAKDHSGFWLDELLVNSVTQ